MEAHEAHAPHPPHTGHRWLDLAMGSAAFVISLVSLYLGVHHGHTMEKLVAANSWPNLRMQASISNGDSDRSMRLTLSIDNSGVGPARLEALELWAGDRGDKPIKDASGLLELIKVEGGTDSLTVNLRGGSVIDSVLGAREKHPMLTLTLPDASNGPALMKVATQLRYRACYCSVFDECYVIDDRKKPERAVRAEHCPVPQTPYKDDLIGLMLSNGKMKAL